MDLKSAELWPSKYRSGHPWSMLSPSSPFPLLPPPPPFFLPPFSISLFFPISLSHSPLALGSNFRGSTITRFSNKGDLCLCSVHKNLFSFLPCFHFLLFLSPFFFFSPFLSLPISPLPFPTLIILHCIIVLCYLEEISVIIPDLYAIDHGNVTILQTSICLQKMEINHQTRLSSFVL